MTVDVSKLEKAFPLVKKAMAERGIEVELKYDHAFEPEKKEIEGYISGPGFIVLACNMIYQGEQYGPVVYVMIPVESHQTPSNWAWLIAHYLVGEQFSNLSETVGKEIAIKFYLTAKEAVYELIEKTKELE
jgi:hypothetical protein